MAVAEVTEKAALTPLNVTAVAPVKFVPPICTLVPTGPAAGVKLVMVGGLGGVAVTVKAPGLVAVPAAVVTLTDPVVAPAGTVVWMVVSEITEKAALTPLNFTAVAPVKFVPLICTLVPTGPVAGVKLVMVGGFGGVAVTVKAPGLVAVPAPVVTLTDPVVAPAGTVVWMVVSEVREKAALTPLNFTAVAPVKFVPLICTLVPTGPVAGVKLVMVGGSSVPAFPSAEGKRLGIRFDPHISSGIRPIGRVRQLGDAVSKDLEDVPIGREPPFIAGDDGGCELLDRREVAVRRHLVDARGTRRAREKEEQPPGLPCIGAVNSDDGAATAAGDGTQRNFGILFRSRRDAPHA